MGVRRGGEVVGSVVGQVVGLGSVTNLSPSPKGLGGGLGW